MFPHQAHQTFHVNFPRQLHEKYILEKQIGEGSYGKVWKGENRITRQTVAIKGYFDIFRDHVDARRILREVSILRQFSDNDHIVKMVDVICPDNLFEFNDFYIVLEYCSDDLHRYIQSRLKNGKTLQLSIVRNILHQILCSLKTCKDHHIMHRDVKPSNILISVNLFRQRIKLCDFGLSKDLHENKEAMMKSTLLFPCNETRTTLIPSNQSQPLWQQTPPQKQIFPKKVKVITARKSQVPTIVFPQRNSGEQEKENIPPSSTGLFQNQTNPPTSDLSFKKSKESSHTKHVVTRWYRPPEIILLQEYNYTADIWSAGCIFAELLGLTEGATISGVLFPGQSCYPMSPITKEIRDKNDEFSSKEIMLFGVSDQMNYIVNLLGSPSEKDLEFIKEEETKTYLRNFGEIEPVPLSQIYPGADEDALDLLNNMIKFNPKERFDIEKCLSHRFFEGSRRLPKSYRRPIFLDYENARVFFSSNDIRALLIREVNYFNKIENFDHLFGFLITELTRA